MAPPKNFNLGEIGEKNRRALILISKVLQNTVNGAEFKEPYLLSMNGFVHGNIEKVKTFMKQLGELPSNAAEILRAKENAAKNQTQSMLQLKEALRNLVNGLTTIKDQVVEKLRAFDNKEFSQNVTFQSSERLISVCMNIGVPKKGKKTLASTTRCQSGRFHCVTL